VRLKVMGEDGDGDKEGGKYLAIQIWSPNTANVISSNVSILNGGLSPGRYWKYLPLWNVLQICYILILN